MSEPTVIPRRCYSSKEGKEVVFVQSLAKSAKTGNFVVLFLDVRSKAHFEEKFHLFLSEKDFLETYPNIFDLV